MKTIETQLGNYLAEHLNLNKDRVKRHNNETPVHLRLRTGNGLSTFDDLLQALDDLKLSYTPADYKYFSRTPDYADQGLFVQFNGQTVGVQFNVQQEGRIARKAYNPSTLGLDGKTFTKAAELYNEVQLALADSEHQVELLSMLDSVRNGTDCKLGNIEKRDVNRLTSDFGEVIAAYKDLVNEDCKIYFPLAANEPIADYYKNSQPISVKGRGTGGKVTLSHWKSLIDTTTTTGKFLHALASHNRDDYFKYGAELCPEVNEIAKMVGGTTQKAVKEYIKKTDYSAFYNYIKNKKEHRGLGIPETGRPEKLWNAGSLEPFNFTINTLLDRLWGETATDEISDVVTAFLKKPKFVSVDVVDNKIVTCELKFSSVNKWKTKYWSRATKAFHNWMGVEPVEGIK